MPDAIVEVFTSQGTIVGRFVNPRIERLSEHYYSITGTFVDADGTVLDRIDFNPEVMPYTADISPASPCDHTKLVMVYVQRGRNPIQMTGVCPK